MSKTILIGLALAGSIASATQTKPAGSVQASYCSLAQEDGARPESFAINKICTSSIVALDGEFLALQELRTVEGELKAQTTIWEITSRTGDSASVQERGYMEKGLFVQNANLRISEGKVEIVSDESGSPVRISGDLGGRKFKAASFRGRVR